MLLDVSECFAVQRPVGAHRGDVVHVGVAAGAERPRPGDGPEDTADAAAVGRAAPSRGSGGDPVAGRGEHEGGVVVDVRGSADRVRGPRRCLDVASGVGPGCGDQGGEVGAHCGGSYSSDHGGRSTLPRDRTRVEATRPGWMF